MPEEMDQNKKAVPQNKSSIFKNCYIHILPVGLGKKRLSLFQTQISNQGGICVSEFPASNCNLTHIVLDDSIIKDSERCVKLLHSMHIDVHGAVKVVGTQWLSKCLKEHMYVDTKEFELSPVTETTDEVTTQYNRELLHEEDCTNEGQDPDLVKNDLGDLPTFTAEHSPPKKLKYEITEVC
jgi:hypothetical protein